MVGLTLRGAFEIGPDATYRPLLVSSVGFATKPPFTLTYRIRPKARWSDGVPVSAADFVFTHRTLRRHLARSGDPHLTTVRSVRAVGPKTVRVVLRSRFAGWRDLFDVVLPRHALVGEDLKSIWPDAIDNPKTGRPIGSGAFLIVRRERGGTDQRIVLRRNPRYWGAHPAYLDQIVLWWSGLSGRDALDALRNGKFDQTGVPLELIPEARRMRGVRVDSSLGGGWEHFAIRLTPLGHPALRSKIVRRALAYGIDRGAIVRELFGKIDAKIRPSDSALLLAQSRYYEPNWSVYRYRPEQARRLLARAGCRLGADGIRVCEHGGRLSLRFATRAGVPPRELTLRLVQAQLRRIGVLVEPVYATQAALFGQILPGGDFDIALFSWDRSPDSVGMADIYGCGGVVNFTGYCQRLVTSDLDQADRILDANRRGRALNRADARIARDVPVIPLFQPPVTLASRTTVRGMTLSAFGFSNLENWWPER